MTYTTNIRLPDELGDRLVSHSDISGIPRNTLIKRAVEAFLDGVDQDRALARIRPPRAVKRPSKRPTKKVSK